jgi:hypothetical protein
MAAIAVGDLIRDNRGRKGIVLAASKRPARSWLALQTDARVRSARGRWWHAAVLDGGAVLVPEALARRIRRANVDDILELLSAEPAYKGEALLRHLLRTMREQKPKQESKPRRSRAAR